MKTKFKHSAEMSTMGLPMIMMSDPNSAPILMSDKGRQSYIDGAEVKHLVEGEDYIFVDVKPQTTNKQGGASMSKPLPLPLGIAIAFILSPLLFLACPFLLFRK